MNRRRLILTALPAALALALGGCLGAPRVTGALPDPFAGGYTLAGGDRLRIIVFGQENLSNIYAVDGGGRIAMPLIGDVPVAGRTTGQVEGVIQGKLRAGFLREPRVTVEVDTYRPFFILGEVTNSGQYPFVSGMTAQTAVAIAGGYTPRGAREHVEITRMTPRGLATASVPVTYPIRPGDTLVVKERWF